MVSFAMGVAICACDSANGVRNVVSGEVIHLPAFGQDIFDYLDNKVNVLELGFRFTHLISVLTYVHVQMRVYEVVRISV